MLKKYPDKILEIKSKPVPLFLIPQINKVLINIMEKIIKENNG